MTKRQRLARQHPHRLQQGQVSFGFLRAENGNHVLGYFKKISLKNTGKFSAKMYFGNTSYKVKGSGSGVSSLALQWDAANKITLAGNKTSKGEIKGKYPDGSNHQINGVVFQKQNLAAGMVGVKGGKPQSVIDRA